MHILKQLTQPAGLASLDRGTGTILYSRGQLGLIWEKKCRPPPSTHLAVLFIYGKDNSFYNTLAIYIQLFIYALVITIWIWTGFRTCIARDLYSLTCMLYFTLYAYTIYSVCTLFTVCFTETNFVCVRMWHYGLKLLPYLLLFWHRFQIRALGSSTLQSS